MCVPAIVLERLEWNMCSIILYCPGRSQKFKQLLIGWMFPSLGVDDTCRERRNANICVWSIETSWWEIQVRLSTAAFTEQKIATSGSYWLMTHCVCPRFSQSFWGSCFNVALLSATESEWNKSKAQWENTRIAIHPCGKIIEMFVCVTIRFYCSSSSSRGFFFIYMSSLMG